MPTMVSPRSPFPCNQCGLCCQRVDQSAETRGLDRGDGTCKHYDAVLKGCSIYQERPDICRVDRLYAQRFAQHYSWDEFVALNTAVCATLQKGAQQMLLYKSKG